MVKRLKKRPVPIALLWTRRDQLRFSGAVEKCVGALLDLRALVDEL